MTDLPGAFVVSLDFELHWGMRDVAEPAEASAVLIESRSVVRELVALFEERQIRATWATVGMLFASSLVQLEPFLPLSRPHYLRDELDPYKEEIGPDEESDPLHLAGSLVHLIAEAPGQEVGSHTFSHFYCLEAGQDEKALRADLASAQTIAESIGIKLTSLVLPRNQWNPAYCGAVRDSGFNCYRGPQPSWGHQARAVTDTSGLRRAARLADTYAGIGPPPTTAWEQTLEGDGITNVPASAFLRPYARQLRHLGVLQHRRLVSGLRDAARRGRIFHLWWHPHNFVRDRTENFDRLNRLLDEFGSLARSDGLRSMSMCDVASAASD